MQKNKSVTKPSGLQNWKQMSRTIKYKKEDLDILKTLQERVQLYFTTTKKDRFGNNLLYLKALLLFSIYCLCSIYIFYSKSITQLYLCYISIGPLSVFLALNIGHEAAHNNFCKSKKLNQLLVFIFDILGASGQIWKYKHVYTHHAHTNIFEVDKELQQPKIVRIFEQSKWQAFHKYQHIYMPFLYSLYTLIWNCYRDFKDLAKLKNEVKKYSPSLFLIFFIGKILFFTRLLILPAIILPFSWLQVLSAFVLLNIASSITTTFALISTHVGEHSEFPIPNEEGYLNHSWLNHQFLTTSDFATENRLITELYGGFNHHLTHHLFPKIAHVHYPAITQIIKDVAMKYDLTLHGQATIYEAMCSHFRLLQKRGQNGEGPLEWMEM